MQNFTSCKSPECDGGVIYAKGFCKRHYGRWQLAQYRENHPDYVDRCRNRSAISMRKKRFVSPEFRQQQVEKTAAWRRRLKEEIFNAYGKCCACCGETEIKFLQLDHIYGGGRQERRQLNGRPWTMTSSYVIFTKIKNRGFPKGEFQILCANCNFGKSINGGVCPHVTSAKIAAEG